MLVSDPISVEFTRRAELLKKFSDEKSLKIAASHYKNNPVDFINDWAVTLDPRIKPSFRPFSLWPRQEDFINWLHGKWTDRNDGLAEKSRDMGVTWMCCAYAWYLWIWHTDQVIGFGSRKQDLVDKKGDPDCIFEKIRMLIQFTPAVFLPADFKTQNHDSLLRIINPANGTVIKGESGDEIGRGGRCSIYFKDEAQPLWSKIVTPAGLIEMGDAEVGMEIIGVDGNPQKITQIKDRGEYDIYQVKFSDGTYAECSPNHLWLVDKVIGKKERLTLSTKALLKDFVYVSPKGQYLYRYRLPVCDAVNFKSNTLPLHSYIVGALIGDGSLAHVNKQSVGFSTADEEILDYFREWLPEGCKIVPNGKYGYRLIDEGRLRGRNNRIKYPVRTAGIAGYKSEHKFIPREYKFSSIEDRIYLLQGLMDTDGSSSSGQVTFHTCSNKLADDVRFIVQSLGGTASKVIKPDHRGYRDMFVLTIRLPDKIIPFKLPRKISSMKKRTHPMQKTIVNIRKVNHSLVRCISVSNKDGLYLTDNCIVTHNSAFYERPQRIEAALSQNSDVKIDVSTPNGYGNPFYQKRHSGVIDVFTFHWNDDPRKDDAWYKKQKMLLDPVIFAQEIDISYDASVDNNFIDPTFVKKAMKTRSSEFELFAIPFVLGVDPARFGSDKTGITLRQGRVVHWVEAYQNLNMMEIVGIVGQVIKDVPLTAVCIDIIGIGAGVFDRLYELYGSTIVPVTASESSMYAICNNKRTEMWYLMREWLKEPCSLPNRDSLMIDLCSLQYSYNSNSEYVLESKKDAKRRGVKSPDEGDSLALTFCIPDELLDNYEEDDYHTDDGRSSVTGY